MNFYNVKKRQNVTIPDANCKKIVYHRETSKGIQDRYAIRAKDDDGTNLTKFIKKAEFDSCPCELVKE